MRPVTPPAGPPPRVDADELRELMRGSTVPLELAPYEPVDVRNRSFAADLGGVHLLTTAGSGAAVVRTPRLARDGTTPRVVVSVLAAGATAVAQRGRVARLRPGEVVAYSTAAPFAHTFEPGTVKHSFMIPRVALGLPERLVDAQLARPLGVGHPLAPVVASYLLDLAVSAPRLSGADRFAVEQPTIELVRALLATTAGDDARARGPLGETLGVRVLEYLRVHLPDRDLTAARVARAHGISERHLYTVLAGMGVSLRTWLREERLAAAAAELGDPARRHLAVAAIAHRWGFADHAHFSRAFRARYGTTPSGFRASRQDADGPRTSNRVIR